MKKTLPLLLALATPLTAQEPNKGTLIFQDDFNRTESQEEKDEPGNGWTTNSQKRAKGHKQVDLKDGALHISTHQEANHPASLVHDAQFTNGAISLRFKLENKKDSLGLNFADLQFKQVHAGHLFAARIHPNRVLLQDLKTGRMAKDTRAAIKAKTITPEAKEALKAKQKSFKNKLELNTWHQLLLEITGETLTATINGTPIGTFTSPGIAHPTKRTLRLAIPKQAIIDDLKIWSRD